MFIRFLIIFINLFGFFVFAENNTEIIKKIDQEIIHANYCHIKTDCSELIERGLCSCNIRVNKNEFARVKKLITENGGKSGCLLKCLVTKSYDCFAGKCVSLSTGDIPAKKLTREKSIELAKMQILKKSLEKAKNHKITGHFTAKLSKYTKEEDCWFVSRTTRPNTPGGTSIILVCSSERIDIIPGR